MIDKPLTPCEALANLRALRASVCQGLDTSDDPSTVSESPALAGESAEPVQVQVVGDSIVRIAATARGRGLTGVSFRLVVPVGANPEQFLNADNNRRAITLLPTQAGSLVAPDAAPLLIQKGHALPDGTLTRFAEEEYGPLIWQAWWGWQFGVLGVFVWEEYYVNGVLPNPNTF